jgi:transketolase
MNASAQTLESIAAEVRGRIIEYSSRNRIPHLACSLSCTDMLVALYCQEMHISPELASSPDRDRFILSKGHAAAALYAVLTQIGFFTEEEFFSFCTDGSPAFEHPSLYSLPGIEASTGSLGHGLPIGLGIALAAKLQKKTHNVYAILGDGECNEGSVWEAAMFAPAKGLDNVCVIVDYNKWQATSRSEEVLQLGPLADKWKAFGWATHEIDGHCMSDLLGAIHAFKSEKKKPTAIVAHTVKGKGVSFMEDDNNWHYRIPTVEEVRTAHRELGI